MAGNVVAARIFDLYKTLKSRALGQTTTGADSLSSALGDRAQLPQRIRQLNWFHQIDFGDGIVSPGIAQLDHLRAYADIYFAGNLAAGKSVLDIGCWDGFNSIEAFRRGASRVLGTDHFVWANRPGTSSATIELAREYLAPRLEIMDIDLPDMTPLRLGRFDIVLFCGVLYHLRDPLGGLERAGALAAQTLIVETFMAAEEVPQPAAIFYPGSELNNDPTNWWGPNRLCVEGMLRVAGFSRIEFTRHPIIPQRGIFRASRV